MIEIRKAGERGQTRMGWLDSRHSFSFGDYYDPKHMNFRALRVINDDRVGPGGGFDTHPHRDSLGTGSVLGPGEVQRMSAGTGILHSEFNPSKTEPVHLYQIWLLPMSKGIQPTYEQKAFPADERRGQLRCVVTPDGRDGTLRIQQDAEIFLGSLEIGEEVRKELARGRHAWVQALSGMVTINGQTLVGGDGAALTAEKELIIIGKETAEVMVFDLA